MSHTWALKVVTPAGTVAGSFTEFEITEVTWELNGWGSATFRIATRDPAAPLLPVLNHTVTTWREVQIWRNGTLIFWGPAIKATADAGFTTVRCVGLLWYLARRYFGPNTLQFLGDPTLESLAGNWSAVGCTATLSGAIRLLGLTSCKLEPTAGPGTDAYLASSFPFTHGGPPGSLITFDVAAWFYIDPLDWTGPALNERGLHVFSSYPGATVFDERFEKVNNDSPRGVWTKLITKVFAPTGVTSSVAVRLYAADNIYWDAASVKVSSYAGASPAADLGDVLEAIAHYGYVGGSSGASLNMAFNCAFVGKSEERMWLTEDHESIWQAVQEWPARNLSDFEVVWNAGGTTRTFTSYAPRKGAFRAGSPLNIDSGSVNKPRTWSIDTDLTSSASQVRVIGGAGTGPTREFGFVEDRTAMGDLSLHDVMSPPPNTTIGVLQEVAAAALSFRKRPVRVPSVTVAADPYLADLQLGDSFLLTTDWGWIQGGAVYRVIGKKLDPKADSLTLVLNFE